MVSKERLIVYVSNNKWYYKEVSCLTKMHAALVFI